MPASTLIPLIIQIVQAAIAAAPSAVDIVAKGKAMIDALFTAQLITKAQQDATHAHLDSLQALALSGIIPPHWQVQPDPA